MNNIKMIRDKYKVDRLNLVEWFILILLLLFITLTLFYSDNIGMFLVYFWKNHELLRRESISALGDNQLTYGIVQQLFCELWALPANIVFLFRPFEAANLITVLWYKLSMVFVFILVLKELSTLCKQLGVEDRYANWLRVLILSTITVALPVFHIAQSDVIFLLLLLLAIRYYFEGKNAKMLLFLALAVSCKYFALIIVVPFILLIEKRLIKILRNCAASVSIIPAQFLWYKFIGYLDKIFFGKGEQIIKKEVTTADSVGNIVNTQVVMTTDEAYGGFISHYINKMLFFEIPAIHKNSVASVLIILFVLLCIWCYVQHKKNEKVWQETCFFAITTAWMLFFCFASPNPYWIVVLYPFLYVLIFLHRDRLRTNLILVNAFSLALFVTYIVNYTHVYGGSNNLDYLFLRGLKKGDYSIDSGPMVYGYLNRLGIDNVMNIIVAICLATAIGLVVVNYPKVEIDEELTQKDEDVILHGFAIWQIAVLAVWYVICVWAVSSW